MNTTSSSTASSSSRSSSSNSRRVITYAGRAEYGRPPKVFHEADGSGGAARIERMEFVIYDFPTIAQHTRRGEYILTGILTAQGHQWRLLIYPRGGGVVGAATEDPPRPPHDRYAPAPAAIARTTPPIHEAEYVSFYLCCVDEEEEEDQNNNARSTSNSSRIEVEPARYNPSSSTSTNHHNPTGTTPTVLAKALFRTTTIIGEFPKYEYNRHNTTTRQTTSSSTTTMDRGLGISLPKEYILQHDCNAVGTLKVSIELQVAVAFQPPPVWLPPRAASFSHPTHSSPSHSSSSSSSVSVSSTDNSTDSNQGNGNGSSLECYSSIANLGSHLYGNDETSDVTFIVGRKKTTFVAHKCILAVRARELYELVLIEESSLASSSSSDDDTNNNDDDDEEEESGSNSSRSSRSAIVLSNVDEQAFEVLLKFIYTDAVPDLEKDYPTCNDTNNSTNNRNTISNKNSKHDTQVAVAAETETSTNRRKAEDMAKVILMVATKFGVTTLKLYMESYLVEKVAVIPAKIAGLLLFADSYSCGLLKEACMNAFVKHSTEIITMVKSGETPTPTPTTTPTTNTTPNNTKHTDWYQLQQSNELLTELLLYSTTGRKHYSSVVEDGIGTLQDAEEYDVTSLRERLQKFQLDVDGSREILVQRWKTYFLQQRPQQDERRRHPQRPWMRTAIIPTLLTSICITKCSKN